MTADLRTQTLLYRIGWWVLVVITGASILILVSGPLAGYAETDMEVWAFFALAAMNIYALVVLFTGYRRGEQWAWWVTWDLVAIYAMTILYEPDPGPYYLGAAVVMAIAQLLTWSSFGRPDHIEQTG